MKKETKDLMGESRDYLTINILHNNMTVMVPCENAHLAEMEKGLSTGEKQMYTRAKKILASEFMYALDKDEEGAENYLDTLLEERFGPVQATA